MTPNVKALADLCRAITHPADEDDRREWDAERDAEILAFDRHYGPEGE